MDVSPQSCVLIQAGRLKSCRVKVKAIKDIVLRKSFHIEDIVAHRDTYPLIQTLGAEYTKGKVLQRKIRMLVDWYPGSHYVTVVEGITASWML